MRTLLDVHLQTANNMGLPLKDIQKASGWSGDSTFLKYYNLSVLKTLDQKL